MTADCHEFATAATLLDGDMDPDGIGHNFWLTRARTGAGFGDSSDDLAERMEALALRFPEVTLYVGDDGKIYQA